MVHCSCLQRMFLARKLGGLSMDTGKVSTTLVSDHRRRCEYCYEFRMGG